MFKGKTILVTGGTGSFGNQIAEKLLPYKPREIRIFSRDEDKQFKMSMKLGNVHLYPINGTYRFYIGDVRDRDALRYAMKGVDVVFNAAALKQVPSCEYHVMEAVNTNIIGANNVIEVAMEKKVKKVITISTDKAVKPVNCMGMTKAIQEKLFTAANLKTKNKYPIFSCVRYGNVVGSRGSVIPHFKSQIEKGQSLSLTDKRMTRFLLTLPDAIELVFKAYRFSVGGEIFIPKIPAAKVTDIAQVMIDNLSSDERIRTKEIGIRPGEKIHEVLISEAESIRTKILNDVTYVILPQIQLPKTLKAYDNYPNVQFEEFRSNSTMMLHKKHIAELLKKTGWI